MFNVELQEGKDKKKTKQFGEFGGIVTCVNCLIGQTKHCGIKDSSWRKAKSEGNQEFYIGDSWFASVTAAIHAAKDGVEFFGPIKTNYAFFPKTDIDK